ncbi:hypothetical protein [Neisseria subflava]|uniref:hypothetical protein n=1 Tax=Neisseria subflava TaxID=28449 RepID=UPI00195E9707|nr:hypothetical protein [Neisseria subflava]
MKSKVIFENRFFKLLCYSGIVVDTSCRSSTSVSGGGFDYVSIQSQTHETLEFFLVDDEGGEASFKFYDWDFSARVGHHVKDLISGKIVANMSCCITAIWGKHSKIFKY